MTEHNTEKRAVVLIGLSLVGEMLHLPSGVRVEQVLMDEVDGFTGYARVILAGDGLPSECTGDPRHVKLRYEVEDGHVPPAIVELIAPCEATQPLIPYWG